MIVGFNKAASISLFLSLSEILLRKIITIFWSIVVQIFTVLFYHGLYKLCFICSVGALMKNNVDSDNFTVKGIKVEHFLLPSLHSD